MKTARLAAASVGALLLAGAWHLLRNAAAPTWDDAWYLEMSFRLWSALRAGPAAFAEAFVSVSNIKAPLVAAAALPLYVLTGPGERAAPWLSWLAHGATAAAVYGTARRLWPEHPRRDSIAALAAALVALIPLLYGLSRIFLVESLLTALVAATAWRLSAARIPRSRRESAAMGILLGLGLLAKSTFPLYVAGLVWLKREELRPLAKTALLVGGLIAATWYASNLPYALGFAWSAGFGRIAGDYASAGPRWAAPFGFLASLGGRALSWPLCGAGLITAAAAARRGRIDGGLRFALAWTAPLAVFAVGVNQEVRFTAPCLPALALLAARASMSFDAKAARVAASTALLAAGAAVFVRQTFLLPPAEALPYCGAPSRDAGWARKALVSRLAETDPAAVVAVALEDRRLNANNLASAAAERGLPMKFTSLGYAQSSSEAALIRLKDKGATRLILVDGLAQDASPAFLNRANAGVAAALGSGRLRSRPLGRVEVAPGVWASIHAVGRGIDTLPPPPSP